MNIWRRVGGGGICGFKGCSQEC